MRPLTVDTLCDEVETYTNEPEGTGIDHVRAGYDRVLTGVHPSSNPPYVHAWSFLRPYSEITISAEQTGTATGVYDSSTYTVITSTEPIFDPSNVGDTITVTDTGSFEIVTYTSRSVVSIAGDNAFAAKAVSFQNPGRYDLPDDWGGIAAPFKYTYESDEVRPQIHPVGPEDILALRRDSNRTYEPRYAAIVPSTADSTGIQKWKLWVFPRPLTTRLWSYRYLVLPDDVTDTKSYFLGSPNVDQAIRYAALADAEAKTGQKPGYYENLFTRTMAARIDADRRQQPRRPLSTASPNRRNRSFGWRY